MEIGNSGFIVAEHWCLFDANDRRSIVCHNRLHFLIERYLLTVSFHSLRPLPSRSLIFLAARAARVHRFLAPVLSDGVVDALNARFQLFSNKFRRASTSQCLNVAVDGDAQQSIGDTRSTLPNNLCTALAFPHFSLSPRPIRPFLIVKRERVFLS